MGPGCEGGVGGKEGRDGGVVDAAAEPVFCCYVCGEAVRDWSWLPSSVSSSTLPRR